MKYKSGEDFLNNLYKKMYLEETVSNHNKSSNTPIDIIHNYINRLEYIHNKTKEDESNLEILKYFYYKKYIIKKLPENYIKLQKRIFKEEGYGDIDFSTAIEKEMLKQVQKEQKHSLDIWIDYLLCDEICYPTWFKVYAFRGMVSLNKFDKQKMCFGKRSESTIEPFVELDREALACVYDVIKKRISNNENSEEEIVFKAESFKTLYGHFISQASVHSNKEEIDGIWIKYNQYSDYKHLWQSLQGKNTGWCTAGEEVCKNQIKSGDFYVYYTKDLNGEYTNPRIAIRMKGSNEIAEVRGVAKEQNLETNMINIAEKKLEEFPDKDNYNKKVCDMKLVTLLDKKTEMGEDLSSEELIFLYQLEQKIDGFGYREDPRIKEIQSRRNIKKDLARLYNVEENYIGIKQSDLFTEGIRVFYGNIEIDPDINNKDILKLDMLQVICGNLRVYDCSCTPRMSNLEHITGSVDWFDQTANELEKLKTIGHSAHFISLRDSKGLRNLEFIGDTASFPCLTNSKGLENLKYIGGYADFSSLTNAKGLCSLKTIGGFALFTDLYYSEGLENLQSIGGYLTMPLLADFNDFINLSMVQGIKFDEFLEKNGVKR